MADVIEFPSRQVEPDSLPKPGDGYQAYALWQKSPPLMLTFVLADGSMIGLPYDQLRHSSFSILNGKADRDGKGAIHLTFGGGGCFYDVVVTGHNIFDLCVSLSEVRWIWELPKHRAAVKDGQPAVYSIQIREKRVSRF